MTEPCTKISSASSPSTSNNGELKELNRLSNQELISLLESFCTKAVLIKIKDILKSRKQFPNADALKDLLIKTDQLEAKNHILEKELFSLKDVETGRKLEQEIEKEKLNYLLLKRRQQKMEKLVKDNITILTEDIKKERANPVKLKEELKLEKVKSERIAESKIWKSKYRLLEVWILQLLENNPESVEKAREQGMDEDKESIRVFKIIKAVAELQ